MPAPSGKSEKAAVWNLQFWNGLVESVGIFSEFLGIKAKFSWVGKVITRFLQKVFAASF